MTEVKQSVITKKMPPPPANHSDGKRLSGTACSACRKSHIRCTHGVGGTESDEEDKEQSVVTAPAPKPAPVAVPNNKPLQAQKKDTRTASAIKQEALDTQASRVETQAPAARGLQREIRDLKAASQFIKQEPLSQLAAQKPAIASGRGWVNVERTPSDQKRAMDGGSEDNDMVLTAAERVKRGRRRPAKTLQDQPPPVTALKRGRGRPRKNSSQLITQATQVETPKRGRGRPRKDGTQSAKGLVNAPKRGRGRPRKNGFQTPAKMPAASGLQIKQEYFEARQQPLREVKAAQTTEVSSPPAAPAPVKKEAGREKKQSALEALQNKRVVSPPWVERFSASPLSDLSCGPPTPPKRKAVEQPMQQPGLKRRTIEQDDDSDY